jgi:hypothetical protein
MQIVFRLSIAIFFWTALFMNPANSQNRFIGDSVVQSLIDELASRHRQNQREKISKGINQVADAWLAEDGSPEEFSQFCRDHYISDPAIRAESFNRYEKMIASIGMNFGSLSRDLYWHLDVETGPILPVDYLFAAYSPWTHLSDDMYASRIAFDVLLNYPRYTLKEKRELGPSWSRRQWAEARLAEWFSNRVPAAVSQKINDAYVASDAYINDYNIYMHHLTAPDGSRPFPKSKRLISHWNMRDEIKAQYAEKDGLSRQEMIYDVMLKIIRQEIPAAVINNPAVDWNLSTNETTVSAVIDGDIPSWWKSDKKAGEKVDNAREPDKRYERWLENFKANKLADPYFPETPNYIQRRFELNREMSEEEVESILTSITASPLIPRIGRLIENRLGRKLRPFDIWYDGFRQRRNFSEQKLDSVARAKYPTAEAFAADIPRILREIGFDSQKADYVASKIQVDPSRGSGHASQPNGLGDKAHLRTRVNKDGMDFKGYNIAVHELGHNVEEIFSLYNMDHILLRGVPITGMSETFAFLIQDKDMELLGMAADNPQSDNLNILDNIWSAYEISVVSLVDMRVWRWLYAHPDATPAELREAVIAAAKEVWNQYCAPVFGASDVELLAIYSHMISSPLYLPEYPLGSIIQFQIEGALKQKKNLGEEIERICSIGSIMPDLWMRQAVGSPISTEPLLKAAEKALKELES